jgi:hypothetical protein
MFKKIYLTAAACAALISNAAHADFAPSQIDHHYESKVIESGSTEDRYYRLPFTILGTEIPTQLWCGLVGVGFSSGQPIARNGIQAANRVLSEDKTSCILITPKDMTEGTYEVTLDYFGNKQTYRFHYTDNEPIVANRVQSEYAAGELILMSFSKTYSRLAIDEELPSGLTVSGLGQAGILISGKLSPETSTSYRLNVIDLESDKSLAVSFTVNAPEPEPKPEEPETPQAVCKSGPIPVPAGGAKFVFRYPTGSACSKKQA